MPRQDKGLESSGLSPGFNRRSVVPNGLFMVPIVIEFLTMAEAHSQKIQSMDSETGRQLLKESNEGQSKSAVSME